MSNQVRVLIADDHAVLRSGLKLLIQTRPEFTVVGEAGTFQETLDLAKSTEPEIITLDLSMPGGQGIGSIERLRRECPGCRILVLTMHDDIAFLRAAMAAGANGYVVKSAADSELLAALSAVHEGHSYFDAERVGRNARTAVPRKEEFSDTRSAAVAGLSKRERTVLDRVVLGHTNQQVADALDLSVKTIESYRSRLLRKLGLKTRADLIRFALETGLLSAAKEEFNVPTPAGNPAVSSL